MNGRIDVSYKFQRGTTLVQVMSFMVVPALLVALALTVSFEKSGKSEGALEAQIAVSANNFFASHFQRAGLTIVSPAVLEKATGVAGLLINPDALTSVPIRVADCSLAQLATEGGVAFDSARAQVIINGSAVPIDRIVLPPEVIREVPVSPAGGGLFTRVSFSGGAWHIPEVDSMQDREHVTFFALGKNHDEVAANSVATCAALVWGASLVVNPAGTQRALDNLVRAS